MWTQCYEINQWISAYNVMTSRHIYLIAGAIQPIRYQSRAKINETI